MWNRCKLDLPNSVIIRNQITKQGRERAQSLWKQTGDYSDDLVFGCRIRNNKSASFVCLDNLRLPTVSSQTPIFYFLLSFEISESIELKSEKKKLSQNAQVSLV